MNAQSANTTPAVDESRFADIVKAAGNRNALMSIRADAAAEIAEIHERIALCYTRLAVGSRLVGKGIDNMLGLLTLLSENNTQMAVAMRREALAYQAFSGL